MKTKSGTLYGIGVGPGDPELIPVKAVNIIGTVGIIYTAASSKNDYSLAVEIARPYIPPSAAIHAMSFPMSKDPQVKQRAWQQHARQIVETLKSGQNAAFLTLGDPLTYSTYGYIVRHILEVWPQAPVVTVPGISSFQAAAAATNTPLVEGDESLLIVSGVHGGERLRALAASVENVVCLKAYRNMQSICDTLEETGLAQGSVSVANCSRKEEKIYYDLQALANERPNYWTLIIAKQQPDVASKNSERVKAHDETA
ncbi:MAG: precorrin-2 C(20)-methyltransferase [Desulfobacteraceae bacterium]